MHAISGAYVIQSEYGNKEAVLEILCVKKLLFPVLSSAEYRIYVKAVLFPWEKKNIIRMTV